MFVACVIERANTAASKIAYINFSFFLIVRMRSRSSHNGTRTTPTAVLQRLWSKRVFCPQKSKWCSVVKYLLQIHIRSTYNPHTALPGELLVPQCLQQLILLHLCGVEPQIWRICITSFLELAEDNRHFLQRSKLNFVGLLRRPRLVSSQCLTWYGVRISAPFGLYAIQYFV
jgi:hypothetical protein